MRLTRQKGFTLIELMIVVAIIGILAAIAIPNFLKFQCKSKQSEAKTNLSGLFTAEKAFLGEYNSYGTDLVNINWVPDGAPLYVVGYASAAFPASVVGISAWASANNNTALSAVAGTSPTRYSTGKMRDLAASQLTSATLPATSLSAGAFTAGASGDIDTDSAACGGSTPSCDQWTIDNQKSLQNTNNDCTT